MEHDNRQQKNAMESVLAKIRSGEIHMTPKAHFTLKVALVLAVAVAALALSSLLASFIFFSVQASREHILLGFGGSGLRTFLILFPWKIFIADIVMLFAFEALVRRFQFGYRLPFVYLFAGIAGIAILMAILINATPLHSFLLHEAEEHRLPPAVGGFYEHLRHPPAEQGVYRGIITAISGDSFAITHDDYDRDSDDVTRKIIAPSTFDVGASLRVGDRVFVAGTEANGEIHAYGVQKLPPGDDF